MKRIIVSGLVGLALSTVILTPAWADFGVPDDVQQFVDKNLLAEVSSGSVREAGEHGPSDTSATKYAKTGGIVPVHIWTEAYATRADVATVLQQSGEWAIPLFEAGEPRGFAIVWKPNGRPEFAMHERSKEGSHAIADVRDDERLVKEDRSGSFFALSADSQRLRPLNAAASKRCQGGCSVAAYGKNLAARVKAAQAAEAQDDSTVGGDVAPDVGASLPVAILAVLLVSVAGAVATLAPSARRLIR